ncbi:hypothetical protein C8R43DRAFT_948838 [Mycena crocata]|nr:hypothetical protein C8R43DRAFT_948838 [Mycena crocata]
MAAMKLQTRISSKMPKFNSISVQTFTPRNFKAYSPVTNHLERSLEHSNWMHSREGWASLDFAKDCNAFEFLKGFAMRIPSFQEERSLSLSNLQNETTDFEPTFQKFQSITELNIVQLHRLHRCLHFNLTDPCSNSILCDYTIRYVKTMDKTLQSYG